jgi:hypothetical protein
MLNYKPKNENHEKKHLKNLSLQKKSISKLDSQQVNGGYDLGTIVICIIDFDEIITDMLL